MKMPMEAVFAAACGRTPEAGGKAEQLAGTSENYSSLGN